MLLFTFDYLLMDSKQQQRPGKNNVGKTADKQAAASDAKKELQKKQLQKKHRLAKCSSCHEFSGSKLCQQ